MSSFGAQIMGSNEKYSDYLKNAVKGKREPQMPIVRWRGNTKCIDLPAEIFSDLKDMYRNYVFTRLVNPWVATENFFEYVKLDIIKIYVRGQQEEGEPEPEFYVDIVFSSCAGQAETSAKLAAHWAGIWYQENKDSINSFLRKCDFVPNGIIEVQNNYGKFIPMGDFGYAIFNDFYFDEELETYSKCKYFEIDCAAIEDIEEVVGLKNLALRLDENFGAEMINGKCKCQLCCPDLNHATIIKCLGISKI